MTARGYLLRYRDAYREAQEIEQKITQVRLKYAMPSAIQYSDMPRSHDSERDLSDYMVEKERLTDMLIAKYTKCIGIEADILERIDSMPDELEREVLRRRYTEITSKGRLPSWYYIARCMHYDRSKVCSTHGKALLHFPVPEEK